MNETLQTDLEKLWGIIREEAQVIAESESAMETFLNQTLLSRPNISEALSFYYSSKLHSCWKTIDMPAIFMEAFENEPAILQNISQDIQAVRQRDPACRNYLNPVLFYKGFQAITCYRVAHYLWKQDRQAIALYFQSLISEVFNVDIHPAAQIAGGIMLDHATGFVAGETAIVEDNVSILHAVTLGGTGKERGDRHPKVRSSVLIGAGAKILGNVEVGEGAKVAACSVVLKDVPPHVTVAGIPAKVIATNQCECPATKMDHDIATVTA